MPNRNTPTLPRSNLSNSPFRYPGGKFYARRFILPEIPAHDVYCEPFAGGASVFFAKETAPHNLLNDLDADVINTLTQIRDRVEDLIGLLEGIPADKETHAYYKTEYQPSSDLTRALRWYYLNRTSYRGIMKPENCYWGYNPKYSMPTENWPPHLRTVSDKLQGTELTSVDFEFLIDQLPDGCFMFVDPPYFGSAQKKFYSCSFSLEDHSRLADCLERNSSRLSFLLTYDTHPAVWAMYSWVGNIVQRQWNYTMNRTDDQRDRLKAEDGFQGIRHKGKELFIRNVWPGGLDAG